MTVDSSSFVSVLVGISFVLLLSFLFLLRVSGKRIRQSELRAYTDSITGGMNGTGLDRKVEEMRCRKKLHHAVIILQLRNYRQLTETFERDKTDRVLKYMYQVLKCNLSNTELIARISGGTFCFLMKNLQESAIRERLGRILKNLNQFDRNEQIPYRLDLRFGVYVPGSSRESLEEIQEKIYGLLEDSEEPLCIYREENKESASRKWQMIRQMDQSLANGDFLVYMQPKVQLSDNRVLGAEALLRWRNPQKGMLTAEMFLPLLEEYQMITRYELFLFEQVCRYMAQWKKSGKMPCPVSVNLSHETIRNKDFLLPFVQLAKQYGIAPELIEFELDGTLQRQDMKLLSQVVEAIHGCDFRCALDNFGGSTVLLHLLRELDVDTIKLDRSFFTSESNNRRNRFVVEAILKIASQMQIRTIAEGIDNSSQVRYLRQAGCDMVQGFHYFRPMTIDEFGHSAFENGELRYVQEDNGCTALTESTAAPNTSGNIVMFSMMLESDRILFSNLFSPVLEGQNMVTNATSLLRHSELIHENDRKDFFHLLERSRKENGWVENAIRFYTAKGRYEWLEVHLHKEYFPASGETVITGTLVNMAGWKNEVKRWQEKANRDALTGLYNREYFEHFTSTSLEKYPPETAAIIFVDIDDFKNVNDTLGHMVGDDVICWFAKRVLGAFRHTDIVARYGGDEFVVFVNGIGRGDLEKRLYQLCEGFRNPYRNGELEYPTSGSIGAAMFPEDGRSYLELLDHADSALYEAKRRGKNCFVLYRPDLDSCELQ